MTRGDEITSPRPSACNADSSRSTRKSSSRIASASVPAGFATGRLTLKRSFRAGTSTGNGCPVPLILSIAEFTMVSLPSALPVVETSPLLRSLTTVAPQRTPRSRAKSSRTITIRDSINTCLTGISRVVTRRRISLIRSTVSCNKSVLVRSSIPTEPRSESREFVLPPPEIRLARSDALA